MTIIYFGDYNPEYARNRVIIRGLKQNRIQVLECNDRSRGIKKYINLIKKHSLLKNEYDVLIVGYSDYSRPLVVLAKLISRKYLVWDAFYSLYDTWVFDKKLVSPNNLKAKYYWFLDWISCRLSDKILLDTNAHIDYFVKTFKIKKHKFTRIFIGADDSLFYPHNDK